MPTFLPMSPVTIASTLSFVFGLLSLVLVPSSQFRSGRAVLRTKDQRRKTKDDLLPVLLAERLDLDVHPGRQVELHQRIDRLRRGLEDIDQTLVRPDLELLT